MDSNINDFKLSVIDNHIPKMATSNVSQFDRYHMPYCPKSPDYQRYINNIEEEPSLQMDDRMNYLESFVTKRLRHNSNMNQIFPKTDFNSSMAYGESNNLLKQTSSWPTLVWSDMMDNIGSEGGFGIPWSMTDLTGANIQESPRHHLQSEEELSVDEQPEQQSNRLSNIWKTSIYTISLCVVQFWYCFTSNEKYKQEMKRRRPHGQGLSAVNSVSKIDKVSRIMFPLIFVFLNLTYWSFYIHERNAEFNQWEVYNNVYLN